jgi:anaerobic ribonucleoside-triphosphate reductase activating protein
VIARIHAREERSRANGPGVRFVVWFQGCSLGCAGCFNPTTHAVDGGEARAIEDVLAELDRAIARGGAPITGVSLSGGEPLQQPEAALALLRGARARSLSTLAFSGYTIDEIEAQPLGPAVLAELDVLIDGRYRAGERLADGLRGSANQRIHCLTDRHTLAEIEATPVAEVRIGADGVIVLTGVDPLKLKSLR